MDTSRKNCHMTFDVKMEDFRRKARLVAGGHVTETPSAITFASVVLIETVRISLTLSDLNDFPVKVEDIKNAYITVPITEKIWTVLGCEFGEDSGRKATVVHGFFGLKIAGAAFRNHLADCMHHMELLPCPDELDLWMKHMVRPYDGFNYYAYLLIYVDNVMVIHHDADSVLRRMNKYFNFNTSSIGNPDIYLGSKFKKMRLENGV